MGSASTFESIESYFPLVDKIVKREIRRLSIHSCSQEDLRSYGLEGLLKASKSYDERRGVSFEIYAYKRIRWAVYDGIRQMGWFPHHMIAKMRFFQKADDMMEAKSTDPPPKDKVEAVHRLSNAVKELAVAYIVSYSEEQLKDTDEKKKDAEHSIDDERLRAAFRVYIQSLPEKESVILCRFFYEDWTLTEIARDLGISVSWASKLMSSALTRLRDIFDNRRDLLDP